MSESCKYCGQPHYATYPQFMCGTTDAGVQSAECRISQLECELAAANAKLAEWEAPLDSGKLSACSDCGGGLLFSARQIGDGLCHRCAHKRLAAANARADANAKDAVLLAKLAADTPQFYDPMQAWAAKAVRDRILAKQKEAQS